jgi:hypothetical protein
MPVGKMRCPRTSTISKNTLTMYCYMFLWKWSIISLNLVLLLPTFTILYLFLFCKVIYCFCPIEFTLEMWQFSKRRLAVELYYEKRNTSTIIHIQYLYEVPVHCLKIVSLGKHSLFLGFFITNSENMGVRYVMKKIHSIRWILFYISRFLGQCMYCTV